MIDHIRGATTYPLLMLRGSEDRHNSPDLMSEFVRQSHGPASFIELPGYANSVFNQTSVRYHIAHALACSF
jgi:hypothetical protein